MEKESKKDTKWYELRPLVRNFTSFIEFLTDHSVNTSGHILVKASPLLAPLPSAIFILIALYGWAQNDVWLLRASFVLTFVVEGLGYSAVYAKNSIEEHNRTNPKDRINTKSASNAVVVYFLVTLGVILGFETIPSWVELVQGTGTISAAIVGTVILIFPVFSYVGSNIYSLMDILERIQKRADNRVDDVLFDLRDKIAKLQQDLLDAEAKHKDELANVAKNNEIATKKAIEIATNQLLAEHKANVASMETELRILRTQKSPNTPVAQPKTPRHRQLTETEESYCRQVAELAKKNEIRTWGDLAKIASWSTKTSQRYGKLAKDEGFITKTDSGLYSPNGRY